jgi:hypothetical protein
VPAGSRAGWGRLAFTRIWAGRRVAREEGARARGFLSLLRSNAAAEFEFLYQLNWWHLGSQKQCKFHLVGENFEPCRSLICRELVGDICLVQSGQYNVALFCVCFSICLYGYIKSLSFWEALASAYTSNFSFFSFFYPVITHLRIRYCEECFGFRWN